MDIDVNVFDSATITENRGLTRKNCHYIDYVNGASANDGRSWATAKKVIGDISSSDLLSGAMCYIAKSPMASIGNATWTNDSNVITLATEKTKTIDMFG